jgi:hypothetical protein
MRDLESKEMVCTGKGLEMVCTGKGLEMVFPGKRR